ncbi:hypothetical protein [Raoultella planticola]|uniref:hypothetical protein n=1 Tax=Raoultella planticola TaxID=575 RepID=UPI00103383BD|nr:hypothetical protein [Raoultella planticola]
MSSIRDSINYIFDTLSYAGGGTHTRGKMMPAKPSSGEIDCFKRLKSRAGEIITLFNGVTFLHFQDIYKDTEGNVTTSDYYAVKNISSSDFQNELFEEYFSLCEVTESFFVFLCPLLKLNVKEDISPQTVSNDLLFQQDDPLYDGHSIEELISYFEPLTIFRLDNFSTNLNNSFMSCTYFLMSSCDMLITLPLAEETISKLRSIFVKDVKIPKDNVFLSLTSSHLKHCFLELYRCIEWLYVIPRARRLKGAIAYQKPAFELAVHCIDELSWRRKEEDSLSKIISDILYVYESVCINLTGCALFKDVSLDSGSIAKHLYSFRNQFVHQFEYRKEKDFLSEDLVEAVDFIADLIIHAYDLYDADIVAWRDEQA